MASNDLFDFMRQETNSLAQEYHRIRARTVEDPGTAGDQGEENWREILDKWLSPTHQVVTRGRILGPDGSASPQVDVLVLSPNYPKALIGKKLYLAGGVVAAFECKNTLKATHIAEAMETSVKIRSLLSARYGSPYKEIFSPIVFGVLAHSHSWSKKTVEETVSQRLFDDDVKFVTHPRGTLDVICVADTATWACLKVPLIGPGQLRPYDENSKKLYGEEGSVVTTYSKFVVDDGTRSEVFTPIGALLQVLYRRMAWEDISMRPLADYFQDVNKKAASGGSSRLWPPYIYSQNVRDKLRDGGLTSEEWSEWSNIFR
ncbi:conserved hypothetical protein [Parvibaculum lavamentivorans DS-1]|uniref:DUF6602 domain-containing protein n=1 Tax=Parvibaculum lavamentivorans (strain DS-1 / DSM 13023 / NCIMB 13966) TaxID=402881 RepID=A7HPP7_PARL1|nr:DUF6602 domain-containing protein [Parvibaculum lavamentivorans]ABS61880.1 conserved hypothetical protein [Parvibaculum lavamentivorans DS-1]